MNAWFYMVASIVFEVCGTTCLKLSEGLSRWVPGLGVLVFYVLAFGSFAIALRQIELSVGYAIWSGLGTTLITVIGFMFFKEPVTVVKIASIALIVLGVVGLNLGGQHG
jgi:small multidrug resistance pump